MTLEQLRERQADLITSLTQTSQQVYILQGHKQEIDYQIGLKLKESIDSELVPKADTPVE